MNGIPEVGSDVTVDLLVIQRRGKGRRGVNSVHSKPATTFSRRRERRVYCLAEPARIETALGVMGVGLHHHGQAFLTPARA